MTTGTGGTRPPLTPAATSAETKGKKRPPASEPQGKLLPAGQNQAQGRKLEQRTAVQTHAQPRVNQAARARAELTKQYQDQRSHLDSLLGQQFLLDQLPSLQHCLDEPDAATDDLPYELVYVEEDRVISIVPPEKTDASAVTRLPELREQLKSKVTQIKAGMPEESVQALKEQIVQTGHRIKGTAAKLQSMGITLSPEVPAPAPVIVDVQWLQKAASQAPGQPPRPNLQKRQEADPQGKFLMNPEQPAKPVALKGTASTVEPRRAASSRPNEQQKARTQRNQPATGSSAPERSAPAERPSTQTKTRVISYQDYRTGYRYPQAKNSPDILCFYDKDQPYYEFTNFYEPSRKLKIDGEQWLSTEHYFQASKFPKDSPQWNHIKGLKSAGAVFRYIHPYQDKRRSIRLGISQTEWDRKKDIIMLKAIRAKARQDSRFRSKLAGTGQRPLFEASPGDSYWGVGLEKGGNGQNTLGAILMQVRDEIRAGLLPPQ